MKLEITMHASTPKNCGAEIAESGNRAITSATTPSDLIWSSST